MTVIAAPYSGTLTARQIHRWFTGYSPTVHFPYRVYVVIFGKQIIIIRVLSYDVYNL